MKDKEIKQALEEYRLTYAPWDCEGGQYCPEFMDEDLIKFGRNMYELGQKAKRSLTISDRNGVEAIEGDNRMYKGKEYILKDMGFQWVFDRSMVTHGDNDTIIVDEDVIWESELVNKS